MMKNTTAMIMLATNATGIVSAGTTTSATIFCNNVCVNQEIPEDAMAKLVELGADCGVEIRTNGTTFETCVDGVYTPITGDSHEAVEMCANLIKEKNAFAFSIGTAGAAATVNPATTTTTTVSNDTSYMNFAQNVNDVNAFNAATATTTTTTWSNDTSYVDYAHLNNTKSTISSSFIEESYSFSDTYATTATAGNKKTATTKNTNDSQNNTTAMKKTTKKDFGAKDPNDPKCLDENDPNCTTTCFGISFSELLASFNSEESIFTRGTAFMKNNWNCIACIVSSKFQEAMNLVTGSSDGNNNGTATGSNSELGASFYTDADLDDFDSADDVAYVSLEDELKALEEGQKNLSQKNNSTSNMFTNSTIDSKTDHDEVVKSKTLQTAPTNLKSQEDDTIKSEKRISFHLRVTPQKNPTTKELQIDVEVSEDDEDFAEL